MFTACLLHSFAVLSLRLEYLTVGWNVVEGLVSVAAALIAGSVALLGFGIDSFFLVSEGREAWRGEDCACVGRCGVGHDGPPPRALQ